MSSLSSPPGSPRSSPMPARSRPGSSCSTRPRIPRPPRSRRRVAPTSFSCRASRIMDLRAMRKTVELLKLVKVPAFAVLNNVPPYGAIADEAAETITTDLGLPVCPVRLGDRVAYNRCLITGQVAQEFEPHGKAAREVEQLYMWTCEQLRMSTLAHARKLTGGHDEPLRRRICISSRKSPVSRSRRARRRTRLPLRQRSRARRAGTARSPSRPISIRRSVSSSRSWL